MKGIINKVALIVCFFFPNIGFGQDPHFSQFFSSPLTLNPASTGNFVGEMRFSGNYRNQWSNFNNAFSTYTASFEARLFEKKLSENDLMSYGILALGDQAGNGLVKQQYLSGSFSFKKGLNENGDHAMILGLQATYGNIRFDASKANFEDQIVGMGFSVPSMDIILSDYAAKNMIDLNVGLIYTGARYEDFMYYLGASIYHLTSPKIVFLSERFPMKRRVNLHGGSMLAIGVDGTLHTSLQFQQQGELKSFSFGAAYSKYIPFGGNHYCELYLGSWYRLNESLIPYFGFEINQLRLGFSYDFGTSQQKTAASIYQTGEISVNYVFQKKATGRNLICPKF